MNHLKIGLKISSFVTMLTLFFSVACEKKKENVSSASQPQESESLLIGTVLSMTGPEATFGTSTLNAIKIVFDRENAAGGINGKKLKLISLDNQSKPEEAAIAITKLITQDKVLAVMGDVASSRSIAMAPIAQSNKIPMLSTGATNPKVTQLGDFIFRTSFIDPFQGPVMSKFVLDTLKLKKVAILKDIKNDYSMGLSQFFKEAFVKSGGQVVVEQSYSAGDIDFKAQLTAIRAAKPEFIYLPGYYTDVGLIVRQARELSIKLPFGGGDGWDSPKLFEIGGEAMDGCYFSNHYSSDSDDPMVQSFVAEYKQKYAETPDALAALGYDSALIMIQALKNSKSFAGQDIRDAMAQVKDLKGVTGTITFNAQRDPIKSAVILKVVGGKQTYVATVPPA